MRIEPQFVRPQPLLKASEPSLVSARVQNVAPPLSFLERVETGSEAFLNHFAAIGKWYGDLKSGAFNDLSTLTQSGLGTYSSVRDVERGVVKQIGNNPVDVVSRYHSRPVQTSPGFRFLGKLSAGFDAVTGILDAAHNFHSERSAGETRYPKTLRSLVTTTGQLMAGGAVGALTLSVAAAGAPAAAAIGGAVAVGAFASWGVGKVSQWAFR